MNQSYLDQPLKDQDDYSYYLSNLSQLEQPWTEDQSFWPSTLMYTLIFVVGLAGNGAVFARLLLGGRRTFFLHKSTASLLASLVSADLVFLAVCVPHEVGLRMTLPWTGSRAVCKLFGFVEMLAAASSVINMAAISLERYVVIVHPMKARMLCTMQNTRRAIAVSWVVSAILSSPLLHITDIKTNLFYDNTTSVRTYICASNYFLAPSFEYAFGWYQLLILFVLPVAVLSFCYITVATVLWRSTKQLGTMTNQSFKFKSQRRSLHVSLTSSSKATPSNQDGVIQSRKKVVKMLVVIVVAFYLCWGPRMVLTLIVKYVPDAFHTNLFFDVQVFIRLLPYLHSCINPIIYVVMNKSFRSCLTSICTRSKNLHSEGGVSRMREDKDPASHSRCCRCFGKGTNHRHGSPGWWNSKANDSGIERSRRNPVEGGKFFQLNEFRNSVNVATPREIEAPSHERCHVTATCATHL